MARPRVGPWYRRSRRRWFVTHDGKQYPLPITDPAQSQEAHEAYRQLVADLAKQLRAEQATASPTVGETVAGFLERKKDRVAPGTYRVYGYALQLHFAAAFGARRLNTLTADEVEGWADRPEWSRSTRNTYLGAVQTLLKWAKSPLPIRRPPKESRGADSVLTDEQFDLVLRESKVIRKKGDFRELLLVLRETGARPAEIAGLTVDAVDWANACARLREHKTRHHVAERVIHFPAVAVAVLEIQRAKYGAGILFRSCNGRQFSPKVIVQRCQQISKRVGFRVIAYGLGRHSFATRALCAGVPDTVVAALLGHTSTTMLHKSYSHVGEQSRTLKSALEKVSKGAA